VINPFVPHDSRGDHLIKAQRLWYDTGRAMDQYGIQMACDAAAATAARIATEREMEEGQGQGYGMGMGGMGGMGLGAGSFRDRRNSMGAHSASGFPGSAYAGSAYGGGSTYGGGSPLQMGGGLPGTPMVPSPIPIPGSPLSAMGGGYPGSSVGGYPGSFGGGYPGSYGGYDQLSVPGAGYPIGGYSAPGTPASGMMVIHQPESHHHRRRSRSRHHHHHRRHRSHDRY
jgi:hypothetical protein